MPEDIYSSFRELGLEPSASRDDLKRAYRALVRKWHPDRWQHGSDQQRDAEERLKGINAAYHRLTIHLEQRPASPERPATTTAPPRARRSVFRDPPPEPPWGGPPEPGNGGFKGTEADAVARFEEGLVHYEAERYKEAVESFTHAVYLRWDHADAHRYLGRSHRALKSTTKAISAFRQAIARRPDYMEAYTDLAAAHIDVGELREALWVCTKAIRRNPGHAPLWVALGQAYFLLGRHPQALEALDGALKLDARQALARFYRGEALLALGDLEGANVEYLALRAEDMDLAMRLFLSLLKRRTPTAAR